MSLYLAVLPPQAGRTFARTILARHAGVSVDEVRLHSGDRGRPYATRSDGVDPPRFSISHSGGLVAVATAPHGLVGVDVQEIVSWRHYAVDRIFSDTDLRRVASMHRSQRDRELTRLWTVFEACSKALGTGLYGMLRRAPAIGVAASGHWGEAALRWSVSEPAQGFWCAIAATCPIDATITTDYGEAMGFSIDRVDHIVVNCRDVDATADWYARVLGMTVEKFGPAGRTALKFGNQKINLRPLGALGDDPDWETGAVEAAGSEDLCFITTATPDDVHEHLQACGVEIVKGPVEKTGALGQMTSHYCRDLDGNLLEIAVYPR